MTRRIIYLLYLGIVAALACLAFGNVPSAVGFLIAALFAPLSVRIVDRLV